MNLHGRQIDVEEELDPTVPFVRGRSFPRTRTAAAAVAPRPLQVQPRTDSPPPSATPPAGIAAFAKSPRLDDVIGFSLSEQAVAPEIEIRYSRPTDAEIAAARKAASEAGPLGPHLDRVTPPARASMTMEIREEDILEVAPARAFETRTSDAKPPRFATLRRVLVTGAATVLAASLGVGLMVVRHRAKASEAQSGHAPAATVPPAIVDATACSIDGPPRILAKRALASAGVETSAVGSRVALGIALAQKSGLAIEIDTRDYAVTSSAKLATTAPIRRLLPILGQAETVAATTDSDLGHFAGIGARSVLREDGGKWGSLVEKGTELVFFDGKQESSLFALPGPNDKTDVVVATRARGAMPPKGGAHGNVGREGAESAAWTGASGDRPAAKHGGESPRLGVALRRDKAIWAGLAEGAAPSAIGALVRLSAPGHDIGAPAIAAAGSSLVVAWAERPSNEAGNAPYRIRLARSTPGSDPVSTTFVLPPGGGGGQAIAPALANVGPNTLLLAWTEGGTGQHQVRAQLVDASSLTAKGEPLVLSGVEENAGQPQIVLDAERRGLIAYFVADAGSYALAMRPIHCAP